MFTGMKMCWEVKELQRKDKKKKIYSHSSTTYSLIYQFIFVHFLMGEY